jgi:hypothetical protein
MKPKFSLLALVLTLSLIVAPGCSVFEWEDSWLRADVRMLGTEHAFQAEGFYTLSSPHPGHEQTFTVFAHHGGQESILLTIPAGRMPETGVYEVLPVRDRGDDAFTAIYQRDGAGSLEYFVGEIGEVAIESTARGALEGRFTFTGVRYCGLQEGGALEGPCDPSEVDHADDSIPRVEIQGSFRAIDGGNRAVFSR